jgi:hypothetical protein
MPNFWKISAKLGIIIFLWKLTNNRKIQASTNSNNMAGKRSCDEGVKLTILNLWLWNGLM